MGPARILYSPQAERPGVKRLLARNSSRLMLDRSPWEPEPGLATFTDMPRSARVSAGSLSGANRGRLIRTGGRTADRRWPGFARSLPLKARQAFSGPLTVPRQLGATRGGRRSFPCLPFGVLPPAYPYLWNVTTAVTLGVAHPTMLQMVAMTLTVAGPPTNLPALG